jgi:hypothetical protein
MNGKTASEIRALRDQVSRQLAKFDAVMLPTWFPDSQYQHSLEFLGAAIQILAGADLVVMAPGWQEARGCIIEHAAARLYGLPIVYLENNESRQELSPLNRRALIAVIAREQGVEAW